MPLEDVGGGFKVYTGPDFGQLNQLVQYQQNQKLAPLKQAQAMAQLEQDQLTLQKSQFDQTQRALSVAVMGDFKNGNEMWQQAHPTEVLLPHPDKAKRSQNIFQVQDMTSGQVRDLDFFAESKMKERIETMAIVAREAAKLEISNQKGRPKALVDGAMGLLEKRLVNNIEDGLRFMQASYAVADGRRGQTTEPIPGTPFTQQGTRVAAHNTMPGIIENEIRADMELQAAQRYSSDILKKPLTAMRPLEGENYKELKGVRLMQLQLGEQVLPRMIQIHEKALSRPNLLNSTVQDVLSTFGQGSEEYRALKAVTDFTFFDKLRADSGANFTETEVKAYRSFIPTTSDTVEQAITKTSALMSMLAQKGVNALDVAQASGIDVGGMRQLLQGKNYLDAVDKPTAHRYAQTILNSFDESVDKKSDFFRQFVAQLPPETSTAVYQELKRQGIYTSEGALKEINRLRKK
jgi:hypothetical protein